MQLGFPNEDICAIFATVKEDNVENT